MEEAKDIIRGGPVGRGDDGGAERDVGGGRGGECGTVSYCEDYHNYRTLWVLVNTVHSPVPYLAPSLPSFRSGGSSRQEFHLP